MNVCLYRQSCVCVRPYHIVTEEHLPRYAGQVYSGNVIIGLASVRPSVPSSPTHRDSPGGSTRRGQRTFPSEYYEDGHTCCCGIAAQQHVFNYFLRKEVINFRREIALLVVAGSVERKKLFWLTHDIENAGTDYMDWYSGPWRSPQWVIKGKSPPESGKFGAEPLSTRITVLLTRKIHRSMIEVRPAALPRYHTHTCCISPLPLALAAPRCRSRRANAQLVT